MDHPITLPEGVLPNFLVIGVRKAATTTLWTHLRDHPDCYVSDRKEVQFFDKHWDEGLDWYRSHFAGHTTEAAIGDVSPTYVCSPVTLDRIAQTIPDARLVMIVRDPVERLRSHLGHAVRWRNVRRSDAWSSVEEQLTAGSPDDMVGSGRYADHLARVAERFSPDQLLVLVYEELVEDMATGFRTVCQHLGIEPRNPVEAERHENWAHDLRLWRLQQFVFERGLDKRFPRLTTRFVNWNVLRGNDLHLPDAVEKRLLEAFADHVEAVERHLGRSLAAVWPSARQ